MAARQRLPGLWPGLILISVGGGLLAREFGILPAHLRVIDFWPLLVVFAGLSSLLRARGVVSALFAFAFIAMGAVLFAGKLGLLTFPAARLWPGLLVLLGLAFLLGGFCRGKRPDPPSEPPAGGWDPPHDGYALGEGIHGAAKPQEASSDDRLNKQFMFSGAQLRIESQKWEGGQLGVTAGGVELDLRNASLAPGGAALDLRVVMGGIEIRVPDTWHVTCEVTPLFGGAEVSARSTQGATNAPRLRVTGTATLGGVDIRN
jgi:hypothetical protein